MIKLYRVWAKYEASHINPLTGRTGQWRVMNTIQAENFHLPFDTILWCRYLGVLSLNPHHNGSIIRPHKTLNEVFQALRTHNIVQAIIDEGMQATQREIERQANREQDVWGLPALFPPTVNVSHGGGARWGKMSTPVYGESIPMQIAKALAELDGGRGI